MELEQPCTKKTPQQLPLVGWEGLENQQPKPQPLDETRSCRGPNGRLIVEPPIHWYGKNNPVFQRVDTSRGADWRWLCRKGMGHAAQGMRGMSQGEEVRLLPVLALRALGYSAKHVAKRMGVLPRAVTEWADKYGTTNRYTIETSPQDRAGMWAGWWHSEIRMHAKLEHEHESCWKRLAPKKHDRGAQRAMWIARHAAIKHTPEYKIRKFVRIQTYRLVRGAKGKTLKNGDMVEYLGCSYEHAIKHIESLLRDGWTWANHGKVWHIDHIVQLSDGSPYDNEHRKRVCHYTNLRPLAAVENLSRPRGRFSWCRAERKAS